MTDARHAELKQLFDHALELPSAARAAFLDSRCAHDAELKQRLLAMLAGADDAHFLSAPTGGERRDGPEQAALREGPGTRLGPYKLLQQIGEGGFGVVFLAEQEQPVTRKVALKIVKLGMDTRQVIARFEQERQALAIMDHPNIARVLDAGATATGRPYFVMDLVKGDPIVEYCDKNSLAIDQRLELFAQVCNAVQHAHGKGIIHRDIKPSNVLVGTSDGRPRAKIIDFGIAKATSQKLTDKTLFTEHQQVIGTLQYMSPEQAEGSLDIDTRTDVYSLGVMLYELLTGSTPFDKATVKDAVYGELRRMIREVDPPRPSTRLSESSERLASIAAHRRVEPKRLGLLLRGDLDWIVMKALEKDRARRYETANGLAADVARHLAGEAVVAAPPSRSYRLRKLVRRNRGVVTAALTVAASLLVGVVAFAWQASIARAERDRAIAAEEQTSQVAAFQDAMLARIDPTLAGAALGDDVLARFTAAVAKIEASEPERAARLDAFRSEWRRVNATDAACELIDRTLLRPAVQALADLDATQPIFVAQMRRTLAVRYYVLGLHEAARPLVAQAVAVLRQRIGATNRETLLAVEAMAMLASRQGKFAEAEALYREVLTGRRLELGADHVETLRAISNLGQVAEQQGRLTEAEQHFRESLAEHRRVYGEGDRATLNVKSHLGGVLHKAGSPGEAGPLLREVVDGRRALLGENDGETLDAIADLAQLIADQGELAEAEALCRRVVDGHRQALGEEHPRTLDARLILAQLWQKLGRVPDAEPAFREVLAARRRRLGDEHPETLSAMNDLGLLLSEQGRSDAAEPLLREAVDTRRRTLGADHAATLTSANNQAMLLHRAGRFADAESLYRDLLARRRRVVGPDDPMLLGAMNNLANLLTEAGKPAEAEPLMREVMVALQRVVGGKHMHAMASIANLGAVLRDLGRLDEAEALVGEALGKQREVLGDDHPATLNTIALLGSVLHDREPAEVVALLAPAEAAIRGAFTGDNAVVFGRLLFFLGNARRQLATTTAEMATSEANLQEAWAVFTAARKPAAKDLRRGAKAFVDLYTAWDALEPGTGRDTKAATWRTTLASVGK
jgi:eukaryotic-like serine/threonine-protein kinase